MQKTFKEAIVTKNPIKFTGYILKILAIKKPIKLYLFNDKEMTKQLIKKTKQHQMHHNY